MTDEQRQIDLTGSWDRRKLGRRAFLGWAGMSTAALVAHANGFSAAKALASPAFPGEPFSLGVASGDPHPGGVVLWTRLAPDPLAADGMGGMPNRKVPVRYEVASDPAFRNVVRRGNVFATPELAHSVHVEVEGLAPAREYFYRFNAGSETSPAGRALTAPAPDARLDALAFAFVSCQNYADGYYTAYRHIAEEDLAFVVHTGDYIYEGPAQGEIGRGHLPVVPQLERLHEYRIRYGQYKSDPDLRAAHARHPFIVSWDDHEVENNYADENAGEPPAVFLQRRAEAYQAYYEHQPLRLEAKPRGPDMQLYRRLRYGTMVELNVLDTRQYRDDQVPQAQRRDPARTMTGEQQERWLLDGLAASQSRWNVLAQQVFFAERDLAAGPAESFSTDAWDGYLPARERIVSGLVERGVANPVVLTGDVHKNYVANVKREYENPDSAAVATELICTSISTGGDGQDDHPADRAVLADNPHITFANRQRGYVRCRLDNSRWQADFRVVPYVTRPGAPVSTRATFVIEDGRPGAQRA